MHNIDGTVRLNLYCDERIKDRLVDDMLGGAPTYWDYTGILLVPETCQDELLHRLLDARCLSESRRPWGQCAPPCRWHSANDTEVHYNGLDKTAKYKIATSWLDVLLQNNLDNLGLVYFYILGLDRSKLDLDRFGSRTQPDRDLTVYNRFFRTAVQKSAKMFFARYERIHIDTIFHDKSSGEEHPIFPWHVISRLGWDDEKLDFGSAQIRFLNSDHREADGHPLHSHFLQFMDLILGCAVNILHHASQQKNKVEASLKIKPLLGDRIIKYPENKNSKYNYFGRQRIEFFPKSSLTDCDLDSPAGQVKRLNNFYTKRELRIERAVQPTLFECLR